MYCLSTEVDVSPVLPLRLLQTDLVRRQSGSLDKVVDHPDQGYGNTTIHASTRLWVGLFKFCCEENGYAFKPSLHLHTKEAFHRDNKGGEVADFPEAIILVILLLLILRRLETLIWWLVPMGEGVSVHDMHVVNTVCPSLPEVADQQVYLLIQIDQSRWWIV